jgi:Domain of unknown function (DUF4864)
LAGILRKWLPHTGKLLKGQSARLPPRRFSHAFVTARALPNIAATPILVSETKGAGFAFPCQEDKIMRRIATLIALFVSLAFIPARADEAAQTEPQMTIQNQIQAFRAGNDALAYSFAAPAIAGYFPTVDSFMAMVKNGYAPLWNPQHFQFGKSKDISADQVLQEVEVIAKDGSAWKALYTLIRLPDGSWKINGVQLLKADGASI